MHVPPIFVKQGLGYFKDFFTVLYFKVGSSLFFGLAVRAAWTVFACLRHLIDVIQFSEELLPSQCRLPCRLAAKTCKSSELMGLVLVITCQLAFSGGMVSQNCIGVQGYIMGISSRTLPINTAVLDLSP